jgi:hypothetical protein
MARRSDLSGFLDNGDESFFEYHRLPETYDMRTLTPAESVLAETHLKISRRLDEAEFFKIPGLWTTVSGDKIPSA